MAAKKRKSSAKRKAPKTRTRTRTVVKYRTRRAPKRRRNPSRARAYAKQTIMGINIPGAVRNLLPLLLGALAGKALSRRFSDTGGEMQNWSWSNYLLTLGGGLAASLATTTIFKGSKATAQKVFEGALLLTAYKFLTLEVAPRNHTLDAWFGEDNEEARLIESAAQAIDPYSGLYGEINEQPEGDFQMLGRSYVPALGQILDPATQRMGQYMEPATPGMGNVTDEFEAAYR